MGNIIDYIDAYADRTFDDMAFNKVDALILSQFSYLKLDGFVPEVGTFTDGITIADMAKRAKLANNAYREFVPTVGTCRTVMNGAG